jgi:hypothetical protein
MNIKLGGFYKNPVFGYQCHRTDGSLFFIDPQEPFVILKAVSANSIDDRLCCTVLSIKGEIATGVFLNAGDLIQAKET